MYFDRQLYTFFIIKSGAKPCKSEMGNFQKILLAKKFFCTYLHVYLVVSVCMCNTLQRFMEVPLCNVYNHLETVIFSNNIKDPPTLLYSYLCCKHYFQNLK